MGHLGTRASDLEPWGLLAVAPPGCLAPPSPPPPPPPATSDTTFKVDADGSGEVEFPEFVELINRLDRGTTYSEHQILEAFRCVRPAESAIAEYHKYTTRLPIKTPMSTVG